MAEQFKSPKELPVQGPPELVAVSPNGIPVYRYPGSDWLIPDWFHDCDPIEWKFGSAPPDKKWAGANAWAGRPNHQD
jgi:hypothetical protein